MIHFLIKETFSSVFCVWFVYSTFKSEIKVMVSYVLLRKLFSQSSYFLFWRLFWRKFRFSNLVRVSCMVRVSGVYLKKCELLIDIVCVWFVYGSCIGPKNPKAPSGILCSPEKIIFMKFIFFSWRNYFGENFRLINFVCVSCMVRVSVKNLKTLRT